MLVPRERVKRVKSTRLKIEFKASKELPSAKIQINK